MSDSEDQASPSAASAAAPAPAAAEAAHLKMIEKLQRQVKTARAATVAAKERAAVAEAAAAAAIAAAAEAAAAADDAAGAEDNGGAAGDAGSDEEGSGESSDEEEIASARPAAPQPAGTWSASRSGPKPLAVTAWAGVAADFERWKAAMSRSFMYFAIPANEQVRVAAAHLSESAWDWFQASTDLAECKGEADPLTWTWAQLVTRIKERFIPITSEETARERLHHLAQGKLSAPEYVDSFRRLINRIPDMGEADQLAQFIRGLRPSIATQLRIQGVKKIEEAIVLAVRVGGIHEQGGAAPAGPSSSVAAMDASAEQRPAWADSIMQSINALEKKQKAGQHRDHGRRGQSGPSGAATGGYDSDRPPPKVSGLSEAQVKEHMAQGLCFLCGQTGHRKFQCPQKKN